jgi:hypothetical protein
MAKKKLVKNKVVKPFSNEDVFTQTEDIISTVVKQKSREVLSSFTKGNLNREELVEALLETTNKTEAQLATLVDTGLSIVGRERISDAADELGLTWYRYIGGVINTTREFCNERNNEYYHQDEIEDWADEDWDGKIEGTDSETIFSFCGGWNCRHELIPVLDSEVPDSYK